MSTILLFRDYFQERESRMKIKRKIKLVFSIFLIVYFLTTGPFPVFAFEMKSNNYHLQLEPSDIDAISQDSSFGDLKKEIGNKGIVAGLPSEINHKWIKIALIELFLIFLIIFLFQTNRDQTKTKFEIKKKK